MNNIYTIGIIKPLKTKDIEKIESAISFPLPEDYKVFLANYGFGSLNNLLMFEQPDEHYIKLNFAEDLDIWEIPINEISLILNSLTIAKTIDGDIILLVDKDEEPFILLPRHSEVVIYFSTFQQIIDYYNEVYKFNDNLYFDPYFEFETINLNLIKNGELDKNLIENIHDFFLKNFSFDKKLNSETQPKYIIQDIGGWVYFDTIYKSTIGVKFQKQFRNKAEKIIESLKNQIK